MAPRTTVLGALLQIDARDVLEEGGGAVHCVVGRVLWLFRCALVRLVT